MKVTTTVALTHMKRNRKEVVWFKKEKGLSWTGRGKETKKRTKDELQKEIDAFYAQKVL